MSASMRLFTVAALLASPVAGLRVGPARPTRRDATALLTAAPLLSTLACVPAASAAPALAPPVAADPSAADPVQSTVGVERLVQRLADAPRRTVLITGANSGVGLAGAKVCVMVRVWDLRRM